MSKILEIIELLPVVASTTPVELPHWGMSVEEKQAATAKGYVAIDARFVTGLRGVELSLLAARMGLARMEKGQLDALELEWRLHKDTDPATKPKTEAQITDRDDLDAILSSVPQTEAFLKARAEKAKEVPSRRVVPERLIKEGVSPDEPVVASFGPHHGKGRPIGSTDSEKRERKDHAKELDSEYADAVQRAMKDSPNGKL